MANIFINKSIQFLLFHTLMKLTDEDFEWFKKKLRTVTFNEKMAIPPEQLKEAHCYDTAACLIQSYGEKEALMVTSQVLYEADLKETAVELMEETDSLMSKIFRNKSIQFLLFRTLMKLTDEHFEWFKKKLRTVTFNEKMAIPPEQLKEAHCYDTAAFIIQSYGEKKALMVTSQVLYGLKGSAVRLMEQTDSNLFTDVNRRQQFILFRALINLSDGDLKRFKDKLMTFRGKTAIPPEQLKEADCYDTAACLIQSYGKGDVLMVTIQVLYEVNLKGAAERLMKHIDSYEKRRKFILFRTLINLSDEDLKRFKDKLVTMTFRGKVAIPHKQLKEAHCYDTITCLIQSYGEENALMVTIQVLYEANMKYTAEKLMEETDSGLSKLILDKSFCFLLFRTLIKLSDEDLKRFKDKLVTVTFRGKAAISPEQLEEAHCYDTAACLIQSYGEKEALMVTIQVLYEANLKETTVRLMEETEYMYTGFLRIQFLLFRTLINLSDGDLKRFKDKLMTVTFNEKMAIPPEQLQNANCYDTAACLIQSYGDEEALMVTSQVLYEANLKDTAEKLLKQSDSCLSLKGNCKKIY
ncbi:uncharacterized protein LOC128647598 [Bombina bombina]|uniref:uncharacterized protein LOC128647598 n=1 Tax=Bombina bombina TaxID=8345 RepID=UPI00235A595B|nr:uncharacterized protein LOC128647598 [Bombina bombina]